MTFNVEKKTPATPEGNWWLVEKNPTNFKVRESWIYPTVGVGPIRIPMTHDTMGRTVRIFTYMKTININEIHVGKYTPWN